jgi:APA family basic amino acid/polyamine antiporter
VRDLTLGHATAIVVGTVIGTGIFLVPKEMMEAAGTARLVFLAWAAGGALSFLGALTYAELGAMKPAAGGEYVYLRDGYGPLPGFLYAWTTILISKPGSIATISLGMIRILESFDLLSFLPTTAFGFPFPISWGQLAALAMIAGVSAINYVGVAWAGSFQLVFTVLKIAIIAGVVVLAFSYSGGSLGNFATEYEGASGGSAGFMLALLAALWAYDGWNVLPMVGGEIRRPERNVPLALIAGMGTVAVLYALMNAAVQYVMPAEAVAASGRPASEAVLRVLGPGAAGVFSALMALQMLATLNGSVLTGGRVPFAAARDGYFLPVLARVHPRYRTPSASIVFQGLMATLLVLLVGKFAQLFSITLFAEWLFYMLTTATVFVFRRREPHAPRPYRTWGYPLAPVLFLGASAVLLYYTFAENLRHPALPASLVRLDPPLNSLSVMGVLVILAGVPAYGIFARRLRSTLGTRKSSP